MKNDITYSSLILKVLNKTIETIKNIEENTTNLNAEQKTLIQELIMVDTENIDAGDKNIYGFFIKVLTEHVREELYSFLVKKGLTSGLASLDTFKAFDRNNQFKELKKVKDIVNKITFTGVNNPGFMYEEIINEYKRYEDRVYEYEYYTSREWMEHYVNPIDYLVKWLKK